MLMPFQSISICRYGKHTSRTHPYGFYDMDRLTMFADYRVPQILRARGVLRYSQMLAQKIDTNEVIPSGSEEEVEIRAATVQAVECLRDDVRKLQELHGGVADVKSVTLDWLLWQEGESLKETLPPHHRTLTVFY